MTEPQVPESIPPPSPPDRTEMPFLDHLEELRWRILKALGAVLLGAIVCFAYSDALLKVLTRPYEEAVRSSLSARETGPVAAVQEWVREWAGQDVSAVPDSARASAPLPPGRQLQSLKPMTYFFVTLQVALMGGIILALPVVFYQVWRFVAPGLLLREKRLILPIISLSVLCFALGAAVAYYLVIPIGLRFFLGLEPQDMTSQWAVDEYISFVLHLLLGFGLVFEMPVVTLFLSWIGLVTPALLRNIRRYAIVAIFIIAAIFTPPDPLSQILMALPLLLLYELSIWLCVISRRCGH